MTQSSESISAARKNAYESTASVEAVADRLAAAERVAIFAHAKPDGDAVGSMLALKRAYDRMGKDAEMFLMGPIEPNLRLIAGPTPFRTVEETPPGDDYDTIIVVDTGAWAQLDPIRDWLKEHRERVVGIDHHARGDDIAPMRLIDTSKPSATAVLHDVLLAMEVAITGGDNSIAEALFVGLATDTGWFRHNNADAKAFALAAKLLAQGVDKAALYQILEETHRPERLALESRALGSMEFARDGTVAIMTLRLTDFQITGGSLEDLTGVVNMPMIVGRVRVSVMLTQTETELTKISFRSKPPLPGYDAGDFIDVNKLAQEFGGGGHVHAAGARISLEVEAAKAQLMEAIEKLPKPSG